jgi:chorismate dehydratase
MRPRVGHIQFLNCLPIYYGLVKGSGILDLDLVKGTPTELNSLLLSGELDISPISSIEYARNADDLILFPGPTVSCRGPVQSILLVSRYPIEDLDGRHIGLTSTSATSQILLKVLLEEEYKVRPRYFSFGEDLDDALARGDAALLIGDRALENRSPGRGLKVFDLGEKWHRATSLGMVFAVWAVRREFLSRYPELTCHVWKLFQNSIEYCTANLDQIAADASRWEKFPASFLEDYFRTLTFGFEDDLRQGLLLFYRLATSAGYLPSVPTLDFFAPQPSSGQISGTQVETTESDR